jgi:hypothetical protein
MYVYVIVNLETLKIYIGQHKGHNLRKYLQTKLSDAKRQLNRRSYLFNAMRKHHPGLWSIHPLISDLQTRQECDYWEKLLIKALKTQHPDVGYNICDGGEGFTGPHSDLTKRKLSEAGRAYYAAGGIHPMLGTKQSPEIVENRRAQLIGQVRTPEQAARISLGRTGKGLGDRNANHLNGLAEDHKQKIGESNKKGWTPERRKAWSEYKTLHNGMKGRPAWNRKETPTQTEATP